MKEIVVSSMAPKPIGPYSQGVVSGNFIFLSGQVGRKHDATDLENGVADQTRQAILNIKAVLAEKNLTLDNVVKSTVFLADMNDFAEMNAVYAEFFDEDTAPARSTVQVAGLPLNAEMEIEVMASLN
ncbi:MAG: RidA family protein [Candidatus Poseidoniales archaeon]|jgi:2-iminobutanoate/2-iminopropanoate deaminase|tara:strand:+ start:566 stop:946 length:381 start_codon:yes stop_codon:yes gene_type:complete